MLWRRVTLCAEVNTDKPSVFAAMNGRGIGGWLMSARKPARAPALGERELAVLEILWREGCQSALQVLASLSRTDIGLSTVQSTLERLYRKKLLSRHKAGRAYIYEARLSKRDIISRLMHDIADELAGGDSAPMISGFMDYIRSRPDEPGGSVLRTTAEAESREDGND